MKNKAEISIFNAIKSTNILSYNEKLIKIRQYGIDNEIPIIRDEGLAFLLNLIKIRNPKKILEIGTAIGYSSIMMALNSNSIIYTIERDQNMYNIAISNINELNLNDRINVIFNDALLSYDELKDNQFDMIFIDAAKAQYTKFFEMYEPLLTKNGIIVCDNMLFHGLTEDDESNMSRSLRGLVRKLNDFKEYLNKNEKYDTTLFDIGDGISVSI